MSTTTQTPDVAAIGTDDTFAPRDIAGPLDAAMDRALDAGFDYLHDEEPDYVREARATLQATRTALHDAGKVAVWWEDGYLRMAFRDRTASYRGSSVEGCDHTDEFVRHLARQFRTH